MLGSTLCFVDIETTGTSPVWDRILEIGIIRVENKKKVAQFHTLLNPQRRIDPFITSLTGIGEIDVANAPTFDAVYKDILRLLKDSIFVAHNVRFDYGFMRNEFKRHEISFSSKQFCTVKLARVLYPGHKSYNLDSIITRHNISCKNRHRALDDAKVLWEFFKKATREVGEENLEKAIAKVMKRPSVPIQLPQEELDSLPERPGVYIFYAENNAPLYIGKSINIRDRVLSHFSSDYLSSTDMKLAQQTRRVKYVQTSGELGALLLESSLIKKEQPLYNKKLRNGRKLVVIKKIGKNNSYYNVEVDYLTNISFDNFSSVVGICKSFRQAKDLLYNLANAYQLCPKLLSLEKGRERCFYSDLGKCKGACTGKEHFLKYNLRFDEAFYKYKIKSWPFGGPIMIKEEGDNTNPACFFVDKWCLLASKTQLEGEVDLKKIEYEFDYDLYKILCSFLLNKKNQAAISTFNPY